MLGHPGNKQGYLISPVQFLDPRLPLPIANHLCSSVHVKKKKITLTLSWLADLFQLLGKTHKGRAGHRFQFHSRKIFPPVRKTDESASKGSEASIPRGVQAKARGALSGGLGRIQASTENTLGPPGSYKWMVLWWELHSYLTLSVAPSLSLLSCLFSRLCCKSSSHSLLLLACPIRD